MAVDPLVVYKPPELAPESLRPVLSAGVLSFVVLSALGMPVIVAPFYAAEAAGLLSKADRELACLKNICQWVRFVSPLAFDITVTGRMPIDEDGLLVWSSNHISNADFFAVLAAAPDMCRNRTNWPRVVYWGGLESNPLFKLFGRSCGMIPVAMQDTGSGNENVYDASSFRAMYTAGLTALQANTDLAILPEGQLNPKPWNGLQRIYSGPFSFSKRASAKLQLLGLYGTEHIWQAGQPYPTPRARDVRLHLFEPQRYAKADEFVADFEDRVGAFGMMGEPPAPKPPAEEKEAAATVEEAKESRL